MIKRKSTLDQYEKAKRNKQVQILRILDLCLQIPTDDRIIIRNRVKEGDEELAIRIYACKKDKNYQALQVYLRKYVQKAKKSNGYFGGMGFSSKQCSSRRGKTPLTLKSKGVATQASYQNSFQNSLQSSPSAKKPPAKAQITLSRFQLQRHIENEIDRQIYEGINNEQCNPYCRGITPRQQENSSLFLNPAHQLDPTVETPQLKHSNTQPRNSEIPLNIKTMLKQKMKKAGPLDIDHRSKRITLVRQLYEQKQKQNNEKTVQKQRMVRKSENAYKSSFYYKKIVEKQEQIEEIKKEMGEMGTYRRDSYRQDSEGESYRNRRYGEFYKRIRMAIEGDI